ncbi:MAG: GntR family transcriptional regulator [Roseiflexaceae bacterium]
MADPPQRTVTAQIVERLRDLILSGELAPGSRVDQADLAQRFGVSIVPVREALARLQSSGLVRIVPHRGVFVEDLSSDELVDIYTVRELLEEHAARLAAKNLTDADIALLEQLAIDMQAFAEAQDFDRFLDLNREMHFTIYRAARRKALLQIISQLWDRSTRYRHLQLHAIPDRARASMFEMNAIIAACRRRDQDAIGYLVRYKIHQTTVGLLDIIHSLPHIPAQETHRSNVAEPEFGTNGVH